LQKANSDKIKLVVYISMAVIALILIIFLILREPDPQYSERSFQTLGTYVTVRVAGEKVSTNTLLDIIENELNRINDKFSANNSSSVIYELNKNREIKADDETLFLINSALNISKITGSAFDLTVRPLVRLWGFDDEFSEKRLPEQWEIENILNIIDYRFIEVDESASRIRILKEGLEIDLGGIAKGYAVDRAINRVKEIDAGATGFVDAGGDIGIIGPKFGKLPWSIGIRNPRAESAYEINDIVHLYSGSIATSGDYERFFFEGDVRYHHILDPKTGYPAKNAISVTVIGDNLLMADALATAIFVLGYDNPGFDYFTNLGVQAMIISPDLDIKETKGFNYFRGK
jgi:thiamine biosynthesis lipoprotein